MSLPVVVSTAARQDLLRLNVFLAEKSEAAAWRAMDAIEAGLRDLGDWPLRGREVLPSLRERMIPFGDSGYVVQYRVDPEVVVIARVFHMKEDR